MRHFAKYFCNFTGIPNYWLENNWVELKLFFIRLYGILPFQRLKISKLLKHETCQLIFGCGDTRYKNWIGIDCTFSDSVDIILDLRRPLPFPNESIDYCYSEHFFEHLYPDEGVKHLVDVYRILKPNGIYRIVVPDAMKFAKNHLEKNVGYFKHAFPWADRSMQAVYDVFNWGGRHRNILDFDELSYMGGAAGFKRVVQSKANSSKFEVLNIDIDNSQRVAESLYVELHKG